MFGAGNGCYENNIANFHNYLIKHGSTKEFEVYFVTTSISLVNNNKFKVLVRGKALTYAMSMIADYLIIDTCNSDISPGIHRFLSGLKVNVNHGFEGFKRLPVDYYKNIDADIHCASSDKEKEIKISLCGAEEHKVFVTGYPRFDRISEHHYNEVKKILYFPTWRSWLEKTPSKELNHSEYVLSVKGLLHDKNLLDYLQKNNSVLYYKPHHKLRQLDIASLECENVIIIKPADNLTDYISTCDVLITDYSSVAWDFLYNDRKVLFYIFDVEEYKSVQGLYFDVRDMKNCSHSLTSEGIVSLLESNSQESQINSEIALEFFKYKDNNNCKRLMSLIREQDI